MPFKRSVSQLGFVDLEHRSAPHAFAKRPTSLREISAAGQELGVDVFFTPQYMWLAEEYLSAKLPSEWSQVFDQQHQAYYYYNSKTGESSWENPSIKYYQSQFEKQRQKDEAQGATVLGMASRRTSITRMMNEKMDPDNRPPQGISEGNIVRPRTAEYSKKRSGGSKTGGDTKKRMDNLRNKLKKVGKAAATMRVKKGNEALRGDGGDGNVYTPKMFEELCQYLGIHIVDRDPSKVETFLVHLALEYLDRVHAGELPSEWTAYMDTDGDVPYYYNARTGENTYDHPLATVLKEQVQKARLVAKDEIWSRGTVADYWLAFGGETVTYYNLRTRKTFRSPPHIAREAAQTIVKVMRLEQGVHVERGDIVDAFHALDGDASGSVSAAELRPVLIHLGGVTHREVDLLIQSADIDGDGEMDYTEFVDTLWRRAADHIQKSKEDGTAGDGSRPNSSGSNNANLVDIHGHLIDANNEQAIQKEEEIAWKTEQEQISVRDELLLLQAKVDQTKGSVKDAWTIIDYNRALDLLSRGRLVQVFDENDKYHTNVHEVAGKIQRAITMYEEAEAERRAHAILQGSLNEAEDLGARRDACKRNLRTTIQLLNTVKITEFKDAKLETSLNGFLYPEVIELEVAIRGISDMLASVEDRANRMPERELDLKENMVRRFEKEVETLTKRVHAAGVICENEIKKRIGIEKRAVQAKEMAEVRARQAAAAAKKKIEDDERERKEALDKLDAEYAKAEEEAELEAKRRQNELLEERRKMKEEMDRLESEQNDEHDKVKDWAKSWDPMNFASEEEREEAEIQHEIKMEEMKIRAAEEKKKNDMKKKVLEEKMRIKEENLRIQLEKEARERKIREDKARELAEAKARWEQDKAKEEQRTKSRERRLKQREDRLLKARAELDDIKGEKREEVKRLALEDCNNSNGDVWDAVKKGNAELVRQFFIVHGTANLLEGKMSRCHHKDEWGRTLVHTAAWWGHTNILRFLLTLGANVNVHDTSVTRTTPLHEAARAGNRRICEFLIRYGAKVNIQDSHGDNAFHWAARRGHGSIITCMMERSEEFQGSVTVRGVLNAENNKMMTPLDVATNETTRVLIKKFMDKIGERKKERNKTRNRIKGGLLRAKMVGTLDTGNEERKKRYGGKKKKKEHSKKMKKKKKKHGPETDSIDGSSLKHLITKGSLPEVKVPKGIHKRPSYIAAVKEANKHHGDSGDGGIPDELVALMGDDILSDFHYGVREY